MTIGELQQSKIIDENEFVCILKGDVDKYCEEFSEKSDELQGFNFEIFEQVHFD